MILLVMSCGDSPVPDIIAAVEGEAVETVLGTVRVAVELEVGDTVPLFDFFLSCSCSFWSMAFRPSGKHLIYSRKAVLFLESGELLVVSFLMLLAIYAA